MTLDVPLSKPVGALTPSMAWCLGDELVPGPVVDAELGALERVVMPIRRLVDRAFPAYVDLA